METRVNRRGFTEHFVKGEHLKITDLKERAQGNNKYLVRENIPAYPRPEFHVSYLRHDTGSQGIGAILQDERLVVPYRDEETENPEDPGTVNLLWWSLAVGPQEMDSAEERLLEKTYPDRTEEQARQQESFLRRFASSPAFMETSRFGSFRFTFPLQELLDAYRMQHCCGLEPVLRVYDTVLYKQEVMYSVLVHDQFHNELFEDYPLLTDSPDAICSYKDGHFIWRPEAMCQTHRFKLVQKPDQNQMAAHLLSESRHQYYVWDNVAVAFHMAFGQGLHFNMFRMRDCLKFCKKAECTVSPADTFDSFEDAKDLVEAVWPFYHTPFY